MLAVVAKFACSRDCDDLCRSKFSCDHGSCEVVRADTTFVIGAKQGQRFAAQTHRHRGEPFFCVFSANISAAQKMSGSRLLPLRSLGKNYHNYHVSYTYTICWVSWSM